MITGFILRALEGKILIAAGILVAFAMLIPALNLLMPPDSPLHVPTYIMSLLGKYLCYAILALSLDLVWGYDYQGDTRTVDVHIRRLREKLELNPAQPEYIITKWGVGYHFAEA